MPKLLVVDDEPNVLYSIEKSLRSDTLEIVVTQTGRRGIELVRELKPDAVILDVRLPDMSGLEVFDQIHTLDPRLPVILITAFAATDTAIEAMKRGAYEYLLKPVDFHQLRGLVQQALELSRFRHVPPIFEGAKAAGAETELVVGRSAAMQEVYKTIGRVAPLDVTVLITGESGTGKELVARALFHHSSRATAPFLALNCSAIPETLLESELFGHERGAFTGADHRRIGKFEQAHKGTLFLDEIGDMSPGTQAKLLRLLQEQRFERVGGNETIATDVRVLAATNKDLEEAVTAGRFRQDLYYRLNGITIRLPPLRERREDIPLLIEHFLRVFNRSLNRMVRGVTPEVLQLLQEDPWPGNVRQLQSVLKYALIRTRGEMLTPEFLPENFRPRSPETARPSGGESAGVGQDLAAFTLGLLRAGETDVYRRVAAEMDRIVLDAVLRHVKGNQCPCQSTARRYFSNDAAGGNSAIWEWLSRNKTRPKWAGEE